MQVLSLAFFLLLFPAFIHSACSDYTQCGPCTSGLACGWCVSTASCQAGDGFGPSAAGACPFNSSQSQSATWEWSGHDCPDYIPTFPGMAIVGIVCAVLFVAIIVVVCVVRRRGKKGGEEGESGEGKASAEQEMAAGSGVKVDVVQAVVLQQSPAGGGGSETAYSMPVMPMTTSNQPQQSGGGDSATSL
mmetsp:Transcript_42509/g.109282  ORF Transcript_42509/g.109282 Transcript_42509/m.109282 type:complete len:189 (-) Transcript_42509:96-662(-)